MADPQLSPEGSEKAYLRFLPDAQKLDPGDIVRYRFDAHQARNNILIGVPNVMAREAEFKDKIPKEPIDPLRSLPDLIEGVIFAVLQVDRRSRGEIAKLVQRASALRGPMLDQAEVFASLKLFSAARVRKIREGSGNLDLADDCSSLAALYRAHQDDVKGKNPITAAMVTEAADVGTKLGALLRPAGGRKRKAPPEVGAAIDARDRLWTLVVQRHKRLRSVGAYLFGIEGLDEMVPPLHSVKRSPRPAAPAKPKSEAT